jgi:hypothetical protein
MEVKSFTDSLFVPLIIQKSAACIDYENDKDIVAINYASILATRGWIENHDINLCYLPNLIRIDLAFDVDIMDDATFDETKTDVYSIVATTPKFLDVEEDLPLTMDQHSNMMKNIINCFDASLISLPPELKLFDSLLECDWTYRIALDLKLFPCVHNGVFSFECF